MKLITAKSDPNTYIDLLNLDFGHTQSVIYLLKCNLLYVLVFYDHVDVGDDVFVAGLELSFFLE